MFRRLALTLVLAFAVAATPAAAAPSISSHVDFAIARGVAYLYRQQLPDGSFITTGQYNDLAGPTALALLALVSAGEPLTKPEIRRAYDFLAKQEVTDTYSVSLRAAAFAQLGDADKNATLRKDTARLIAMQIDRGPHRGLYSYGTPRGDYTLGDLSNSQYGVLGVWYAAEAGVEVPRGYWQRVEAAWTAAQSQDGGFAYRPDVANARGGLGGSYGSMTAAGIATLAITHDFLHAQEAGGSAGRAAARSSRSLAAEEQALGWLAQNFVVDKNPGRDTLLRRDTPLRGANKEEPDQPRRLLGLGQIAEGSYVHYMLFGYERVGEATGLTRFGGQRWFEQGARYLVATQSGDGAWANGSFAEVIDTSYALLFLSRGRSPVVIQKLQWDTAPAAGGASPVVSKGATWNNRTRDAASITRWLRKQTERHVNWQLTRLDYPAAEVREGPLLYAASDKAFDLPEKDWAALKRYIDEGGLLLAADESTNAVFASSVEKLLSQFYPNLVFRDLPPDHPFLNLNFRPTAQKPGGKGSTRPAPGLDVPVRVLSNGVREIALVLPRGDFPWRWQKTLGTIGGKSPDFALVGNALVSVTGRASLRNKGTHHYQERDDAVANSSTRWTLARAVYPGNWNPEPLAHTAFANHLHNTSVAELTTDAVALTDSLLSPGRYPVLHLAATHAPSLSAPEQRALAGYLQAGGFLLYDTAGGIDAGAELAIEQILVDAIPDLKVRDLPSDHAIYAGVLNPQGQLAYRPASVERTGARQARPRLRAAYLADRLVAVLSAEDLTAGLLNLPHNEIIGPEPDEARRIVTNVLRLTHSKP